MSGRTEYAPAHEVRAIAERLIPLLHPHLVGVRVEYVFVSKPPMRLGRPLAGRARKVTGLFAYLATPNFEGEPEPFFLIEITKPIWDAWPAEKRIALVNHELKHCGYDEESDTLAIVPHDIEEFDDIARWHGAWDEGLLSFVQALESTDERLTEDSFAQVNYGAARQTEKPLARIDLRRSQNPRDQQTRGAV